VSVAERIVIAGAGGQVGRAVTAQARRDGRQVLALTSAQWDITDPASAEAIIAGGDVVINCAAYTNVDGAESDPQAAHAVNTAGPDYLARACARVGAALVHISTDYVFSGVFENRAPRPYEPDDEPAPLSVYGRSKLDGERAVRAALPTATVVRTAWVYTGATGSDFVAALRRLAAGGDTVEMVDDQIGSPTYVADLTAALLQVADGHVDAGSNGVVHAANDGAVSRFELARAVFTGVGADPARIRPVSSASRRRPAARPAYSALSGRASVRAGLAPLRGWHEALATALA
jgi:dTDP-4-dehydrorhamnose reductase